MPSTPAERARHRKLFEACWCPKDEAGKLRVIAALTQDIANMPKMIAFWTNELEKETSDDGRNKVRAHIAGCHRNKIEFRQWRYRLAKELRIEHNYQADLDS